MNGERPPRLLGRATTPIAGRVYYNKPLHPIDQLQRIRDEEVIQVREYVPVPRTVYFVMKKGRLAFHFL